MIEVKFLTMSKFFNCVKKLKVKNMCTIKQQIIFNDLEPFSAELPPPRHKSKQNGVHEKPIEDKAVCDTLPQIKGTPVPDSPNPTGNLKSIAPMFEEWYHGALPRKHAEKLLQKDGDFLVRKSSSDPNQFVLSGRQNGMIKHLLLVDPDGVVRKHIEQFTTYILNSCLEICCDGYLNYLYDSEIYHSEIMI